jgi:hypothetical protein
MRVCEKHRERAIETLRSLATGTEYDLCAVCLKELSDILNEKLNENQHIEGKRGRKSNK